MTRWAVSAVIVAGALAFGCGPQYGEAFSKSFRAGQRAYGSGRYAEAATYFDRAARDAQRVKDRDEALFLRARMFERLERWEDAAAAYRRLVEVSQDGPRVPRATYELATLEIEHGDAEAGWKALAEAIERYPSHGSAARALTLWAEHTGETHGEEALRERLDRWEQQLAGTESEQRATYEKARSFRRSGELEAAFETFLRAAHEHPYPEGPLTDDAYWLASEVAEAMGAPLRAVSVLEELLASREVAVGGSYERPRFPEAQMRIGELYRDLLDDPKRARDAFRATHENHDTSILADDAMWQEARMARRIGNEDAACEVLAELRDDRPESRYAPCLGLLCERLGVSDCPRYIARGIEGGR